MLQQSPPERKIAITRRLWALFVFAILFATTAVAQGDPELEKKNRLNRVVPPKAAPPHYKPPKNRVLIPINKKADPANVGGPLPQPLPTPPSDPAGPPVPPPPAGFSNLTLDFSSLEVDLTDDPELHIFIDNKEVTKKQRLMSEAEFILENIVVGNHTLKITHPMIQDFTLDISVSEANRPIKYPNLQFDVTHYRLIILSDPLASICINEDCQHRSDEDGIAVFYLLFADPYNLKAVKAGLPSREEKKFYLEKPETILDLRFYRLYKSFVSVVFSVIR